MYISNSTRVWGQATDTIAVGLRKH